MQSTLTTQVSMEKARKERKVERKVQRKRCIQRQREKASNRIPSSNPMLQPPKSLHQLSRTPSAEETWSAHEANWSWDSNGYHTDQYYPEEVWRANEATWHQWTYFADGQTDRPQDEERHSSEPRPRPGEPVSRFPIFRIHMQKRMTGEEHVSHQYHLNPAGSSTDYRHSGCSEVIDPTLLLLFFMCQF